MAQPVALYVTLLLAVTGWTCVEARTARGKEAGNTTLSCSQNGSLWWILPDQTIVSQEQQARDGAAFLDGEGRLTIVGLRKGDDGTYSCSFYSGDLLLLRTQRLEVEPLLVEGDAWNKYHSQFVAGLVAAGVAAGLILFGCLVFRFRWRDPGKQKGSSDRDGLMPPPDFDGAITDQRF